MYNKKGCLVSSLPEYVYPWTPMILYLEQITNHQTEGFSTVCNKAGQREDCFAQKPRNRIEGKRNV